MPHRPEPLIVEIETPNSSKPWKRKSTARRRSFSSLIISNDNSNFDKGTSVLSKADDLLAKTAMLASAGSKPLANSKHQMSNLEKLLQPSPTEGRSSPPLVDMDMLSHKPLTNVRRRTYDPSLDARLRAANKKTDYIERAISPVLIGVDYIGGLNSPQRPNVPQTNKPKSVRPAVLLEPAGAKRKSFASAIASRPAPVTSSEPVAPSPAAPEKDTLAARLKRRPSVTGAPRRRSSFAGLTSVENDPSAAAKLTTELANPAPSSASNQGVLDPQAALSLAHKEKQRNASTRRHSFNEGRRKSLTDANQLKSQRTRDFLTREVRELQADEARTGPVRAWLTMMHLYPRLQRLKTNAKLIGERSRLNRAARTIQRGWKMRDGMRHWEAIITVVKKYKPMIFRRVLRQRRKEAGKALCDQLVASYRHAKFNAWSDLIRARTVQAQRLFRTFVVVDAARRRLLSKLWEETEGQNGERMRAYCAANLGIDMERVTKLGFGGLMSTHEAQVAGIKKWLRICRRRRAKEMAELFLRGDVEANKAGLGFREFDVADVKMMLQLEKVPSPKNPRSPTLKRNALKVSRTWTGSMLLYKRTRDDSAFTDFVVETFVDEVANAMSSDDAVATRDRLEEEKERNKVQSLETFKKEIDARKLSGRNKDFVGNHML